MKNKYFIDTDTASDDAVALLMALEWDNVEVLGISIVSGNMSVEQGSINARSVSYTHLTLPTKA